MTLVTKLFAKLLLGLIGLVIPVFIAACYGMQAAYTRAGRVIDRATQQGISGIKVSCVGQEYTAAYSGPDGSLWLDYDEHPACSELRAEDVDGAVNGSYASTTVPFCSSCGGDFTIEMDASK